MGSNTTESPVINVNGGHNTIVLSQDHSQSLFRCVHNKTKDIEFNAGATNIGPGSGPGVINNNHGPGAGSLNSGPGAGSINTGSKMERNTTESPVMNIYGNQNTVKITRYLSNSISTSFPNETKTKNEVNTRATNIVPAAGRTNDNHGSGLGSINTGSIDGGVLQFVVAQFGLHRMTKDEIRKYLRKWDKDRNGFLSKQEIKEALNNLGSFFPGYRAQKAIAVADMDGDGCVNMENHEFEALINYVYDLGIIV